MPKDTTQKPLSKMFDQQCNRMTKLVAMFGKLPHEDPKPGTVNALSRVSQKLEMTLIQLGYDGNDLA